MVMSVVPPDEIWSFLLGFFENGDQLHLGVLADRLEEASDPRGPRLRRRWRAQPGMLARAKAKGREKVLLAEARLEEYILDLFPECRRMYDGWAGAKVVAIMDRFLGPVLRGQPQHSADSAN
jgi:hypothetical protein